MQIIEKNKDKATGRIFRLAFSILDNSAAMKKKNSRGEKSRKHSDGKLYLALPKDAEK